MKRLLVSLLALGSISCFAQSEFERGYYEGFQACEAPKEAWHCSIERPESELCNKYSNVEALGKSRAHAILNIDATCLVTAKKEGIKPVCTKL